MRPIENVLQRLPEYSRSGKGFKAPCPAHDDKKPSLSVTEAEDGRVLLRCHAGCSTENVIEALNLSWKDLSSDQENNSFLSKLKKKSSQNNSKKTLVIPELVSLDIKKQIQNIISAQKNLTQQIENLLISIDN